MMFEFSTFRITDIIRPTLLGMASFLISGVMAAIVISLFDNYILATMIAGGIGGLLLGIFLRMRRNIKRIAIAGIIGMPMGLITSFFLVEGFGSIFPSIGVYLENTDIPDISAIILMGIIFGAVAGAMIYGRKSICLFSIVCGIVSFPFGLLVAAMNSECYFKVWLDKLLEVFGKTDLNFLAITISLGIGTGLSIGLHSMRGRGPQI